MVGSHGEEWDPRRQWGVGVGLVFAGLLGGYGNVCFTLQSVCILGHSAEVSCTRTPHPMPRSLTAPGFLCLSASRVHTEGPSHHQTTVQLSKVTALVGSEVQQE